MMEDQKLREAAFDIFEDMEDSLQGKPNGIVLELASVMMATLLVEEDIQTRVGVIIILTNKILRYIEDLEGNTLQ